jgi:histidinol-phosphate aminotransferase
MSRISQAGALAALQDVEYLSETQNNIATARARIDEIARENGLSTLPSATNFVAIDCGQDGAFARKVLAVLVKRNLFVRMPFAAPQDRCIRLSAGRPQDLDVFALALPEALKEARS